MVGGTTLGDGPGSGGGIIGGGLVVTGGTLGGGLGELGSTLGAGNLVVEVGMAWAKMAESWHRA
jgi:hypothetical protein